ncbi:phage terminase large subunit [Microbulbifer sp. ZKSA002]|uniref:phage terminase large subunit n=1 Tax=Microbulbifer sp. ZKSA002 TaxID=3243388 RepID=UPI004039F556
MAHEVEKRLKDDFLFFLYLIWKHLNLPNPTRLQNDIARALGNSPKRLIIQAFRGCGKSFITSAFVVWMLYRDPQLKIMVVSASKERADAFSQFTKRLIGEVPWLQHLRAKSNQRDSLIAFDVGPARVDHSPSVKSVGITGQLTGSRADIIIADDVEVLNNSATQTAQDKLSELVKEFDAILKPYDPALMEFEPKILFLGTPQHEMSLYSKLPERGYKTMIWPALYPKNMERYKGALARLIVDDLERDPSLVDQPTDPQRFTKIDLDERLASYGKAGFALQFMLDTTLSDAEKYPLKVADLIVSDIMPVKAPVEFSLMRHGDRIVDVPNVALTGDYYYHPDWASDERLDYEYKLLVIDPSGRGKDLTGVVVLYFLRGYIFLAEARGFKEGYAKPTLRSITQMAKRHGVHTVLVEDNFGDGMFTELLRPVLYDSYACGVEETKSQGQKERRIIDCLEPVMMQHRLVVAPSVIERDYENNKNEIRYSLFYQMTRITYEKGSLVHDDLIDPLAMGVKFFTDRMAVDTAKVSREHREQAIDDLLNNVEKFMSAGSTVVSTVDASGATVSRPTGYVQ